MSNSNDGYGVVINGLTRSMVSRVGPAMLPNKGFSTKHSDVEKAAYMKLVREFDELTYPTSAVVKAIYDAYGIDLSRHPLANQLAFFKPDFNGEKEIRLKDGTKIKDQGSNIECSNEPENNIQERAYLVVSMAKAKGWRGMSVKGSNEYILAVWMQCKQQGIKVHPTPEQMALYEAFVGMNKQPAIKGQIQVQIQQTPKSLKL